MPDMQQVHPWFLHRGLPLVLPRRVRSRDLIDRSAPMVCGVGALTAVTLLPADLTSDQPDFGFALRLGIVAAVLVAAPFALISLLAIWLTYLGFGSIALWAFRFARIQVGGLGTLMSRALPLLMLTVVV